MPGDHDLVIYFRCYRKAQVFDVHGRDAFLSSLPFGFFHAVLRQHGAGKLWVGRLDAFSFDSFDFEVMAEPSMRPHPTVQRLRTELRAEIFSGMDQARLAPASLN